MSKAVYMGAAWGAPVPIEVILWDLAEHTKWTLEYIDSLPLERLHEWLSIQDGRARAMDRPRKRK